MFGHDDIAEEEKAVSVADHIQSFYEAIAPGRGAKKRQSVVAAEGDEVEVALTIEALEGIPMDLR
jgi:hypothetical protein